MIEHRSFAFYSRLRVLVCSQQDIVAHEPNKPEKLYRQIPSRPVPCGDHFCAIYDFQRSIYFVERAVLGEGCSTSASRFNRAEGAFVLLRMVHPIAQVCVVGAKVCRRRCSFYLARNVSLCLPQR